MTNNVGYFMLDVLVVNIYHQRLPRAEVNISIGRYFQAHVFPGHVVILCLLHIPEVSIWCPYKACRVKSHVEWSG